jgi:vacuolar protein-sorting-associated protein 4
MDSTLAEEGIPRRTLESTICRLADSPNIKLAEVAGLGDAKQSLWEAVIQRVATIGGVPLTGVLLYGPPGTGKSYLARACAAEARAAFFSVESSNLDTEPEPALFLRTLFAEAQFHAPSIILMDENTMHDRDLVADDGLADDDQHGSSAVIKAVKRELKQQMDATVNAQVVVMRCTQRPWTLTNDILQRFPLRVHVGLELSEAARAQIARTIVGSSQPQNLTEADWAEVGEATVGYSGADIAVVARNAMWQPIKRLRAATHFKKVSRMDQEGNQRDDMLEACRPDDTDPARVAMTWMDIADPSQLAQPELSITDFRDALSVSSFSLTKEDLVPYAEFDRRWGAYPFSDILHEARELSRARQRLVFALSALTIRAPPHLGRLPSECVEAVCAAVPLSCPASTLSDCSRQPCLEL